MLLHVKRVEDLDLKSIALGNVAPFQDWDIVDASDVVEVNLKKTKKTGIEYLTYLVYRDGKEKQVLMKESDFFKCVELMEQESQKQLTLF